MTYPRHSNGHTDDGHEVNVHASKRCPGCGRDGYRETISREWCPHCGIECDYWGGGANEAMNEAMERRAAAEAAEDEERAAREREEASYLYD